MLCHGLQIVSEFANAGGDLSNGTLLSHQFWNRSLEFPGSGRIYIDSTGERASDHCFLSLNNRTGNFEVRMEHWHIK